MRKLQSVPLTGKRLLQKITQLTHLSKREKAKECGYYHYTDKGGVKVDLKAFMEALLVAADPEVVLETATPEESTPRKLTYTAKVNKNGQILIGSAYTKQMNLHPGDEFEIKLGDNHIQLKQVASDDDADDEEDLAA